MTYRLTLRALAYEQLQDLRKGDKNTYIKCFDLILAIITEPREGIGKSERLKGYNDAEVYSRRVNEKDRIVYEIVENESLIEIISCVGHYGDK